MKRKFFLAIFMFVIILSALQASAFQAKTKWEFQSAGIPTGGLAIHQNALLFGDWTGQFYALDKSSGSVLWHYNGNNENAIIGTPAVSGENVFFAYADGEVTCLKISDGSLVWRHRPYQDDLGFNDGIAVGDGLVFAARKEGELLALDIKDGHLIWSFKTSQNLQSAPAHGKGFVFLGEDNGIFDIIEAKSGKRVNGGGAGGSINTPVVDGGNLYVSAWDNSVQAVQIKDVIPLWNSKVKYPVTTAPAISDGIIVVGSANGSISALSQKDGNFLWERELGSGSVIAKPLIADGLVFAATDHGNLEIIEADTGRVKFTVETQYGVQSSPAYSDGVFYFFGGNKVQALQ